jgi:membrane-bound lytic murein transglycosylase B
MASTRYLLLSLALAFCAIDATGEMPTPPIFTPTGTVDDSAQPVNLTPLPSSAFRGWDYLVQKLRADGVNEETLRSIYADPRMPFFGQVRFGLKPRESKQMYAPLLKPEKLELGREFLKLHEESFAAAEKDLKVHRTVIAAILLVETHYGKNTGRELVINRLSRVASVREPTNLILNHRRHLKDDPSITFAQVDARAEYLERTFYPEVKALLQIIDEQKLDPFELKGSSAGAFGLPQFLPTSFQRFGYDGNKDGAISLFDPTDAIWSTANFLAQSGWKDSDTHENHREVIWKYNKSDPYIDTVLAIAKSLRRPPPKKREKPAPPPRAAAPGAELASLNPSPTNPL